MVQKRETRAINKLCVREILSLSFVCGAYFFEFRGRNLVCFVIAYRLLFQWQICAGSREDTHAHCVFHACLCTPYSDLYVEAMTERAAFFRLQVFKRVRISPVEVY